MIEKSSININNNCFDIIRAICAFTVFLGHFITHFGVDSVFLHEIAYFVRGVPVFFLLSGFFIARSLERYTLKDFFIKRAIRIFPELWVVVVLNLVIIMISVGTTSIKNIVIYMATQMTVFQFYTGSWLREYGVGTPNGALWTITVDIQFYIIAFLLARLLKTSKLRTWSIVILSTGVVSIALERLKEFYPTTIYKLLQCNLLPFIWIFLIGMFVYYNREVIIKLAVKIKWIVFAIYIVWQYVVPSSITSLFEGVRYNIITTFLLIILVIGIGFSFGKRFKHDYSYSFYLYHMVVINFIIHNICAEFVTLWQCVVCFVITTIIICAFAFLSQRLVADKISKLIEKRIF